MAAWISVKSSPKMPIRFHWNEASKGDLEIATDISDKSLHTYETILSSNNIQPAVVTFLEKGEL